MSHPYDKNSACQCKRCVKERTRRAAQSQAHQTYGHAAVKIETLWRNNKRARRIASRTEQQARYLDCGPQAWDDRD